MKFLMFAQKKAFLLFLEMEPCTFQPKLKTLKEKKNQTQENF